MLKRENSRKKGKWVPVFAIAAAVVIFLIIYFVATEGPENLGLGNVALIKINGLITTDENSLIFSEDISSSSDIVENLKDAEKNTQIKAVILEINSPGGSAVASEEIAKQISNMSKPVIAVIRDVGASGAYWAASASDRIVASPVSITGSIGVTASYLEFTGLMEKYGVEYEEITAGEYKDMGSPFRNLTEEEKGMLKDYLEETRKYFVENVAANRKMSYEYIDGLATGQIYLGKEAWELGLIDSLGGREEAERILREEYGMEKINYYEYKEEGRFLKSLSQAVSGQSFHVGEGIGSSLMRKAESNSLRIKA